MENLIRFFYYFYTDTRSITQKDVSLYGIDTD